MARAKRTVLVVEDSANDAALIRVAFRKLGFSDLFQTVVNVKEAIRYLKGEQAYADIGRFPTPDLVLLDHQMPGDGVEIIKWIRDQPSLRSLPVVVFSGSEDPRHERDAIACGANAYYQKPQSFGEFTETVRKIIETWALGGTAP